MRNRSQWISVAGNLRGAGQWVFWVGVLAAAAGVAGCRGGQYGYPGVPQPAYSQAEYFQPGHEEELAAEAARLRQQAQPASYEESGMAVASDQDSAAR